MAMILVKVPNNTYTIDMWYWCSRTFGKPGTTWDYSGYNKNSLSYSFEFSTREQATQFVLTWLS